MKNSHIKKADKEVYNLIIAEGKRQKETINLIASENFVSDAVLEALGSVFVNKYSEGYPDKRYYGGNSVVDKLEKLCQKRALKLFKLSSQKWSVNVQPYSGSPANLAVYFALVPLGAKIMGMRLDMGGHLTHGHIASATGKLWKQISYSVNQKTELLDYDEILKIARKERPALIVAGYTAYSRIIDFKKFREIADAAGAILMVDMSHFAGLVAGDAYPSPFKYADVVTTTTHKTLRGPRSAMIFSRKSPMVQDSRFMINDLIDRAIFPGLQGGPHMNQIASVAVALAEAARPEFKKYAKQVVKNAKALSEELQKLGWRIVSGGTDTHLFLINTWEKGISGKIASDVLEKAGIIVNKNTIPFDKRSPADPSGIRIGAAAITTAGMNPTHKFMCGMNPTHKFMCGMKEKDMKKIADKISNILIIGGLTNSKKRA